MAFNLTFIMSGLLYVSSDKTPVGDADIVLWFMQRQEDNSHEHGLGSGSCWGLVI